MVMRFTCNWDATVMCDEMWLRCCPDVTAIWLQCAYNLAYIWLEIATTQPTTQNKTKQFGWSGIIYQLKKPKTQPHHTGTDYN